MSVTRGVVPILLAVAVIAQSSHLLFGVGATNMDFIAHLLWAQQVADSVAAGHWLPRWVFDTNLGLGSPALLYYAPGYFHLVAIAKALCGDLWVAIRAVEFLANVLTGLFAYHALRALDVTPARALGGAVVLQLAPVPFLIALHFNGLPWATSFAALSALFWWRLRRERAPSDGVDPVFALLLAGVILMHVLSGLMALIVFSAQWFTRLGRGADGRWHWAWPWLRGWLLTVALALGLAAFYLIPALTSFDLASTEAWTRIYKPFRSFLLPVFTAPGQGMRWPVMQVPLPMLFLSMIVGAAWFAYRFRARLDPARRRAFALLTAIAATAFFLGGELSYPLWTLDTPLLKLQFPWRFTVVLQLCAVLMVALMLDAAARLAMPGLRRLAVIVLLGNAVIALVLIGRMNFHEGQVIDTGRILDTPFLGIPEYRPSGSHLDAWRGWVRAGGLARECAAQGLECVARVAPDRSPLWRVTNPGAEPVSLTLPLFDLPAWRIWRDDGPVAHEQAPGSGLIRVSVPPGTHDLRPEWQRLPREVLGFAVSLAALLVGLWGMARRPRRSDAQTG